MKVKVILKHGFFHQEPRNLDDEFDVPDAIGNKMIEIGLVVKSTGALRSPVPSGVGIEEDVAVEVEPAPPPMLKKSKKRGGANG